MHDLRVLLVEDFIPDADLIVAHLLRCGYQLTWSRVDTPGAFLTALDDPPDIVLCDYSLPQFGALEALDLLIAHDMDVPLIVVSGTIGEETAVQTILHGATDYLLKDRLERLQAAIERALELRRLRLEREAALAAVQAREAEYRLLLEQAADGIVVTDAHAHVVTVNEAAAAMLGLGVNEVLGHNLVEFIDPRQLAATPLRVDDVRTGHNVISERVLLHRNGSRIPVETSSKQFDDGRVQIIIRDITERRAAAAAMAALAAVVSSTREAVTAANLDDEIFIWNNGAEALYGYPATQAIGQPAYFFIPDDQHAQYASALLNVLHGEAAEAFETTRRRSDGTLIDVRMTVFPMRDADGVLTGISTISHDITERKRAEDALRRSEEMYRTLARHVPNGFVLLTDQELHAQIADGTALERINLRREQLVGQHLPDVLPPAIGGALMPPLAAALEGVSSVSEVTIGRLTFDVQAIPVRDESQTTFGGLLMAHDITERKRSEQQLEQQLFYDQLTGLPNRALFLNRLEYAVERASTDPCELAVLMFSVERLGTINESLGYNAGDEAIRVIAARVRALLPPQHTVARLSGHEFAILLDEIAPPQQPVDIARQVITAIEASITIVDTEAFVSASMGIVVAQPTAGDAASILRDASAALLRARANGRGQFAVYDPSMHARAIARAALEVDLRRAVQQRELHAVYQPIIDLTTGAPVGAEALVRWNHPHRGMMSPAEFLPLAEDTGLILEIDRIVLAEACRQARIWRAQSHATPEFFVSVNLDATDFRHTSLLPYIRELIAEEAVEHQQLQLELTETVLLRDEEHTLATLQALRDMGVRLTIDDFGTGYSSLAYLTQFPVDGVKIDRRFMHHQGRADRTTSVIAGIANLCHALDLRVTAEGIETTAQLAQARFAGCDDGQGFLFSRPLSAHQMGVMLANVHDAGR